MSTVSQYAHIEIDSTGVARVADTRYTIRHLAGEHYHYGWSAEEMLRQHPDLKPEEVYAALAYYYDHRAEFVAQFVGEANAAKADVARSLSRAELLARKSGGE